MFFTQHKRVAEYCVIFDDESGATKGTDTSKQASKRIKAFYRFVRHFGDFIIIMTEQNSMKNADYQMKKMPKCCGFKFYWYLCSPFCDKWNKFNQKSKGKK